MNHRRFFAWLLAKAGGVRRSAQAQKELAKTGGATAHCACSIFSRNAREPRKTARPGLAEARSGAKRPALVWARALTPALALACALALPACSNDAAPQSAPQPRAAVLALGDSLTAGHGGDGTSWPQALEKIADLEVVNAGIDGDTSDGALRRLPDLLKTRKFDLLIVGVGGNDFLRKRPEDETERDVEAIVQTARSEGIEHVVLLAEPHFTTGALLGHYSDHPMYGRIAQKTGAALFANGYSKRLSDKSLRSDAVHLNARGYELFARDLKDFLKRQGLTA